ncbi:hypothetical protein ACLOJK_040563 [Asimina triloba]
MEDLELEDANQKDPFVASDTLTNSELLVGSFKKTKDPSGLSDVSMVLARLSVMQLPLSVATQATFIGVESFEGEYGGIEFSNNAFGGGLDVSEFMGPMQVRCSSGLGDLEELQTAAGKASPSLAAAGSLEMVAKVIEQIEGPQMYIVEEIDAEFRESLLARVGLRGIIYLRTIPPRPAARAVAEIEEEAQFSFEMEGTVGIKRAVIHGTHMSNVGNGMFHPKHTPLKLPVDLSLLKVSFVLKLPADPTLRKVHTNPELSEIGL